MRGAFPLPQCTLTAKTRARTAPIARGRDFTSELPEKTRTLCFLFCKAMSDVLIPRRSTRRKPSDEYTVRVQMKVCAPQWQCQTVGMQFPAR
jgi:hypothetical protein